jgi:hypothetical protein
VTRTVGHCEYSIGPFFRAAATCGPRCVKQQAVCPVVQRLPAFEWRRRRWHAKCSAFGRGALNRRSHRRGFSRGQRSTARRSAPAR